ncbi:MAG: O-antigen ligase family protein [Planctomycetes bacterium]|nr:O-antigen ligase family protein [Planctomycetota bacterium]
MAVPDSHNGPDATARRLRNTISRVALVLALALLAAAWLLISPSFDAGYPGARPWSEFSLLKSLTELMALGGALQTARGVEIKDFAFHLAAAAGLLLLAVRAAVAARWALPQRTAKRAWFYSQVLLAAWVGVSALSARWSGDASISLGQASLFALALAWAVALGWTLESRDVPRLLAGLVVISAVGALICLWYYYERNPLHNPGFPIGNPNVLATCLLPAILISVCVLIGAARSGFAKHGDRTPTIGAAAALVPLVWCLVLTESLAAWVGLGLGAVAIVFLCGRRPVRMLIGVVAVTAVCIAGWWATTPALERFAAERPTMRFRLYSWRYAALMWEQRQIFGVGAGSYTRFARQYAVGDRELDPGAFMGAWTAHAHNELFEVFSEIGLVGGVTFVAGYVATLVAMLWLLRSNLSDPRRWLLIGLAAGLAAQLGSLMFGVGLRLPGGPAVFYTLLGTIWAASRCASRSPPGRDAERPTGGLTGPTARRIAVTSFALVAAGAAGWLALRNWSGVLHERSALAQAVVGNDQSPTEARHETVLTLAETAEGRLLDPVRRFLAQSIGVEARFGLARAAFNRFKTRESEAALEGPAPRSSPRSESRLREQAIVCARQTYFAARALDLRAPTFGRMPALGARSAEVLAELLHDSTPDAAREWLGRAHQAWALQKRYDRYDVAALLALLRYSPFLSEQITLLRDALRAGSPRSPAWTTAFERVARTRGFSEVLSQFERAARPIHPQTDLDSLIVSRAPEVYRLVARAHVLRGEYALAQEAAERAAGLYEAMRLRFPVHMSVALAEQAEYALAENPRDASSAVTLMQDALKRLPQLQQPGYDQLARPYRMLLGRYLLMAGREADALEVFCLAPKDDARAVKIAVETYVTLVAEYRNLPREARPPLREWADAALRLEPADMRGWSWVAWLEAESGDTDAVECVLEHASAAGVSRADIQRIRNSLGKEFPDLFGNPQSP